MKKQKMYVVILVFLVVLVALYAYFDKYKIPEVRKEIEDRFLNRAEMVLRVKDGVSISQSTKLTQTELDRTFEAVPVPETYIPMQAVRLPLPSGYVEKSTPEKNLVNATMKSELIKVGGLNNKFTTESLESGEILMYSNVEVEDKKWSNNRDKEREFVIENDIAGTLKEGHHVDLIVNYENGDYDVVASHKKVESIIKPTQENNQQDIKIIIAVSEIEYRNLNMARKYGKLEVRKYKNTEQPASKVTFNYELAKEFAQVTMDALIAKSFNNEETQLNSFNNSKYNQKKFIKWFNEKEINPLPIINTPVVNNPITNLPVIPTNPNGLDAQGDFN